MDDVTVFKLVSIIAIWLVGLAGGLVPALLATKRQQSPIATYVLSVLNAFSGGVFLAGGFFHLLHSAIENEGLKRWSEMDEGRYEFPYAEMFCTLGFLALLLLEQAAHAKMNHGSIDEYTRAKDRDDDDDHSTDIDGQRDTDHTEDDYLEENDDEEGALRQFVGSPRAGGKSHSQGHSHGHSHLGHDATGNGSLAVAAVLFIALSFHSVLEGLGIGAQQTSAWGVFFAIVVHKGLAAFALGSGLARSSLRPALVVMYMVLFSFMSIIGIIVGWIIAADSSEDSAAAGICVALASGTFIYVAVMEVIPQEFPRHPPRHASTKQQVHKTAALCMGYAIFGLLAKWS
ncbi:TPA: hypothetical protein N0F65_003746 [Lagenidium giganteum]|uniref:Uncharacterized protein n=1 Tax=Lagenidium giganteum TaxID=4803 RepID=A0AAV2YPJ5_9STRA|nr:TPA: hypothetical protein N0F65_003746 [Lagenidium giganteum]